MVIYYGEQYSLCSRVINVVAAALWAVGSQFVWDLKAHSAAATTFITLVHVKYLLSYIKGVVDA